MRLILLEYDEFVSFLHSLLIIGSYFLILNNNPFSKITFTDIVGLWFILFVGLNIHNLYRLILYIKHKNKLTSTLKLLSNNRFLYFIKISPVLRIFQLLLFVPISMLIGQEVLFDQRSPFYLPILIYISLLLGQISYSIPMKMFCHSNIQTRSIETVLSDLNIYTFRIVYFQQLPRFIVYATIIYKGIQEGNLIFLLHFNSVTLLIIIYELMGFVDGLMSAINFKFTKRLFKLNNLEFKPLGKVLWGTVPTSLRFKEIKRAFR